MIKSLYDALITDTLGGPYKTDPEVIAFGYALRAGIRMLLDHADRVTAFSHIDNMGDDLLTLLAAELRTPYYDESYSLDVKRRLIKNTLAWYEKAGTRAVVEELGATIFGTCDLEEWDSYDGEPYHFRIITDAPASSDSVAMFNQVIRYVKNTRSYLESVSIRRTLDTTGSHAAGAVFSVTNPPPIRVSSV